MRNSFFICLVVCVACVAIVSSQLTAQSARPRIADPNAGYPQAQPVPPSFIEEYPQRQWALPNSSTAYPTPPQRPPAQFSNTSQQSPTTGTQGTHRATQRTTLFGHPRTGRPPQRNSAQEKLNQLRRKLLEADEDARDEVRDELKQQLEKIFDAELEKRDAELSKLEAQVSKLRQVIEKRAANRDRVIGNYVDSVMLQAEGLGFANPFGKSRNQNGWGDDAASLSGNRFPDTAAGQHPFRTGHDPRYNMSVPQQRVRTVNGPREQREVAVPQVRTRTEGYSLIQGSAEPDRAAGRPQNSPRLSHGLSPVTTADSFEATPDDTAADIATAGDEPPRDGGEDLPQIQDDDAGDLFSGSRDESEPASDTFR